MINTLDLRSLCRSGWIPWVVALVLTPASLIGANYFLAIHAREQVRQVRTDFEPSVDERTIAYRIINDKKWAKGKISDEWLNRVGVGEDIAAIERLEGALRILTLDYANGTSTDPNLPVLAEKTKIGISREEETKILNGIRVVSEREFPGYSGSIGYLSLGARQAEPEKILVSYADSHERVRDALKADRKKADFVLAMIKDLNAQARKIARPINVINGVFQYATFLVFFIACGQMIHRIFTLEAAVKFAESQLQAKDANRHSSLVDIGEHWFYQPLEILLALLPTFGFLGTVYGLGVALSFAGGLTNETTRPMSIDRMSEMLGVAFDTTLVALICSMVADLIRRTLKKREIKSIAQSAPSRGDTYES